MTDSSSEYQKRGDSVYTYNTSREKLHLKMKHHFQQHQMLSTKQKLQTNNDVMSIKMFSAEGIYLLAQILQADI